MKEPVINSGLTSVDLVTVPSKLDILPNDSVLSYLNFLLVG